MTFEVHTAHECPERRLRARTWLERLFTRPWRPSAAWQDVGPLIYYYQDGEHYKVVCNPANWKEAHDLFSRKR